MHFNPVTGNRSGPPYVYHAFPQGDDEAPGGGGTAGKPENAFSDVSLSKNKRAPIPKGLISLAEVKRLFGRFPHVFDKTKGDEKLAPMTHDEVWKFQSEGQQPGYFVIKPIKFADGNLKEMVRFARYELWSNDFGEVNFSKLRLDDKEHTVCAYRDQLISYGVNTAEGPEVFIISKFIPSRVDESHYRRFGASDKLTNQFIPFHSVFGLWDLPIDNVREPEDGGLIFPEAALYKNPPTEMLGRQVPAFAIIDTGGMSLEEPWDVKFSNAYTNRTRSPWIGQGSDLDRSMQEVEKWKTRLSNDEYVSDFLQGLENAGLSKREARRYLEKIVLVNIERARKNMDFEIAAFREEIPLTVLEKLDWKGAKPVLSGLEIQALQGPQESRTDLGDGISFQVISQPRCLDIPFANGTRIILDINQGSALLLIEGTNKKVTIKSIFDGTEGYLVKNQGAPVGKGTSIAPGLSSQLIDIANIAGTHIRITDKQMVPDPEDRVRIRIYR